MKSKNTLGFSKLQSFFTDIFGFNRMAASCASALIIGGLIFGIYWFFHLAPPRTITITTGPEGSSFYRTAERYQKILAPNGVKLKIIPSEGSVENLKRLTDPKSKVDIGFVQGGVAEGNNIENVVSLGSVNVSPLLIFYRSKTPVDILSQFSGKRIMLSPAGSGAHLLALKLLKANGIEPGGKTELLDKENEDAAKDLLDGKVDAAFLMAESTSTDTIRLLLHSEKVRLYNFTQADAYVRRNVFLAKLEMPQGAMDFGKNIPPKDVSLVGPTIELVAKEGLHPALIDLLLEAAQEVHGKAGLYKRQGEYPAPMEREYRMSPDAVRFYKSGKGFLYRSLPFWLASLVNRVLLVFVPVMIVLIPALKSIPAAYKWRIRMIIYRWYRQLLAIEREMIGCTAEDKKRLLERLEHIETAVNKMKVPASFGDQFYVLRGHIDFVRSRLSEKC
jgi:TRAP-type uncharacterized transport system substrate-binding protein